MQELPQDAFHDRSQRPVLGGQTSGLRAHAEPLLPRVWALRENLTAYDAVYVALAEALDTKVLTCDGRLGRAPGLRARVEVMR